MPSSCRSGKHVGLPCCLADSHIAGVIGILISSCFGAGALLHSKQLTKQQLLQDKAVAAADASGQAAIAAATAGHKAAAMRMKQKLAQLAPTKGLSSDQNVK